MMFRDQGRLDDPHLWEIASTLGFDITRFERDRRSATVEQVVTADFTSAIRAGVATSPTLLVEGQLHPGVPDQDACERLSSQPAS